MNRNRFERNTCRENRRGESRCHCYCSCDRGDYGDRGLRNPRRNRFNPEARKTGNYSQRRNRAAWGQ